MSVSQRVEGGDWILFVADGFRCPSKDWMTIRFDEFSYFWDGLKTISQKTIWHLVTGHLRNLNWRYLPYIRLREYPHKIWSYMVQYLHFRILKFPLILCRVRPPFRWRRGTILLRLLRMFIAFGWCFFPFPCLHALVKDVWSSKLSRDTNSMSRKKVHNGTFSWTSGATGLSSVGAGESHPESALVWVNRLSLFLPGN